MKRFFLSLCTAALTVASVEAQIGWDPTPVTISTSSVAASQQEVAMDPSGNTVAVWVENGFVVSKSLPYQGSWSPSVTTLSGAGASSPQVVVDSLGNATAVWVEAGLIKTSSKPFGGSWAGVPVTLSGALASQGSLTVDGSGNIVAIWTEGGVVKSSTKLFGGSWQVTPDTLSGASSGMPQVATNSLGEVFAVWQESVASVETVYVTMKTMGGSWGGLQSISTPGVSSGCPQIAVDSSGNAMAVWFRYVQSGTTFSKVYAQSVYYTAGGSWTSAVDISSAGYKDPSQLMLQVAFDATGDAAVIWSNSSDGSTFDMYASILPYGGSWIQTGAFTLQDILAYQFDSAVLNDDIAIVYMSYNPYTNQIGIYSIDRYIPTARAVWSIPMGLTTPGAIGYPKLAAIESSGDIYGVGLWLAYNGSINALQANVGSATQIYPPSNLVVQGMNNNFGVLEEPYNQITWSASPNATGYRLFRNGILITETGATTLIYNDANQSLPTVNTYTLVGTDNNGGQSSSISINYP